MFFVLLAIFLVLTTYFVKNILQIGGRDQSGDLSDPDCADSSSSKFQVYELPSEDYYLFEDFHSFAADNNVRDLTKLLSELRFLDKTIDLNQTNDFGLTPLHFAAIKNKGSSHYGVIEILLKNGADPNFKDNESKTPLWDLFQNQASVDILKLFFKFGADFTCKYEGSSLLSPATTNCNNLDVLRFLIQDIGLDVNHRDEDRRTCLHEAVMNNNDDIHYEVIKFLLEMGADPNARDRYGETPLFPVIRYSGKWEIIELFLKHNSDLHAVNDQGQNLLFAFDSGICDARVLDKLINNFGLNVYHTDINGRTPLHNSIDVVHDCAIKIEVMKCFVRNGVNINAPNKNGNTLLISAMSQHIFETERWFSENLDYFDFLMDHTDFSIVHNNKHIFKEPQMEFIWKLILAHLAKINFLRISIHPVVLEFINNKTDHKDYFEKCTKELKKMKNSKPQNCGMNYLNLLVDSRRTLKNFAGNPDLTEDLEKKDWLKMFPIYGASIKKNFEKGLKRRKLYDESAILLSECVPIFKSSHLIVRGILDCIMSKKDLSKFCSK